MLDLVRFEANFADVDYLVFEDSVAEGIVLYDGHDSDVKRIESELAKRRPDVAFGCEWSSPKDHMDYPKRAMRIQTARAIRDASCIYAFTPAVFERKTFEVARFNAKVLAQANVPVVFVSLARNEKELAHPKDLSAIGRVLGFSDETIAHGRSMLERLREVRYERGFRVEVPRDHPR